MIITDNIAKKIVKSIKCYECKESIESYPEDERDGKTDLEIIREEVAYFVYMFEEVEGVYKGDLDESREILRETHNGKFMPITNDLRPKYSVYRIENARRTISEYRQLKRILTKI